MSVVEVASKLVSEDGEQEEVESSKDEEQERIGIPKMLEIELGLVKVSAKKFKEYQINCPSHKQLWEKGNNPNNEEFCVKGGKLVWVLQSRKDNEKVQLCVPEIYSKEERKYHVKVCLCVMCKYRDIQVCLSQTIRVLRCYFWPKDCHDLRIIPINEIPIIYNTFIFLFPSFGVKVSYSSVCYPESNSLQRLYSTLKNIIIAFCFESGRD